MSNIVEGPHFARHQTFSPHTIFMYMDVTDKGPDQSCRKRLTAERIEASGCKNIVYVPGWRFLHMFNASVKDGLILVDQLLDSLFSKEVLAGFSKYFAGIGKVVNTWREKAFEGSGIGCIKRVTQTRNDSAGGTPYP